MNSRVPVLDLDRYEYDRKCFVRDVGRAYRETGFCGFFNHGIRQDVIDQAYRVFKRFFALHEEIKSRYAAAAGGQRGYTGLSIEQAKGHSIPDLKEFWHVGREVAGDNPWPDMLESNLWPAEVPDFRQHACELYAALMPFFLHPNPDFMIRTLPQCISENNPDRYPEPISSNDFLAQRLKEIKLM